MSLATTCLFYVWAILVGCFIELVPNWGSRVTQTRFWPITLWPSEKTCYCTPSQMCDSQRQLWLVTLLLTRTFSVLEEQARAIWSTEHSSKNRTILLTLNFIYAFAEHGLHCRTCLLSFSIYKFVVFQRCSVYDRKTLAWSYKMVALRLNLKDHYLDIHKFCFWCCKDR